MEKELREKMQEKAKQLGNEPINGEIGYEHSGSNIGMFTRDEAKGLTKREYFAGLAMQGLLSNLAYDNVNKYIGKDVLARHSRNYADALLEELAKTE